MNLKSLFAAGLLVAGATCAVTAADLPDGYLAYDCLNVCPGAYVETGVLLPKGSQITAKFSTKFSTDRHLFGSLGGGSWPHCTTWGTPAQWCFGLGGTETKVPYTANGCHELVYGKLGTGEILMDGQVIAKGADQAHSDGQYPICLFMRHVGGKAQPNFVGTLFSFAITNSAGVGLLDYVPCRRLKDGCVGFYDRITGAFKEPTGGRLDPPVSAGLEKLEYAFFPKQVFVDTGCVVTNVQVTITFDALQDTFKDAAYIWGSTAWSHYPHLTLFNNTYYWGTTNVESNALGAYTYKSGKHTAVYGENDTGNVLMDGQVIGGNTLSNTTKGASLLLGARPRNNNEVMDFADFRGRIYAFEVKGRDGELRADLSAARRLSDGKVGFYDRCTDTFLEPEGGNLLAPDEPLYEELDYLLIPTKGTYFDTGIKEANVQVSMDFEANYVNDMHMFGSNYGKYIHLTTYNKTWYWGTDGTSECNASGRFDTSKGGRHRVTYGELGTGNLMIDGQQINTASQSTAKNKTCDYAIRVGYRSGTANFVGKIYSFAITNSAGVGLVDYVPCYYYGTRQLGFWDRINQKFVAPSGTKLVNPERPMPDAYKKVASVPFRAPGASLDTDVCVQKAQITVEFSTEGWTEGWFDNMHILGQRIAPGFAHLTQYGDMWYWGKTGSGSGQEGSSELCTTAGAHKAIIAEIGTKNVVMDGQILGSAERNEGWTTNTSTTATGSLLIGRRNAGLSRLIGTVSSVTVTNHDGTAVMDLRPCVRKSDGKYGFWDCVRGRFLTDATLGYEIPEGSEMPAGFRRLDWIGLNGAYVNTHILATSNLTVEATFRADVTAFSKTLFGVFNCAYSFYCTLGTAGGTYYNVANRAAATATTIAGPERKRHTINLAKAGATVDGASIAEAFETNGNITWATLLLGAFRDGAYPDSNNTTASRYKGRLYGFKAWYGATLFYDLAPAVRESDGMVGLFDLVGGRFLTPAVPTDSFTAGPDYGWYGTLLILK